MSDQSAVDELDDLDLGEKSAKQEGPRTRLVSEAFLNREQPEEAPAPTPAARVSAGLLDEESETPAEVCSNCGVPKVDPNAAWCSACGFYPQLGVSVEVDQEVEAMAEGAAIEPAVSIFSVVPAWAWTIGIGALAVIGVSFSAWKFAPEGSRLQTLWGCGQASIGSGLLLLAHIGAFIRASVAGDAVSFVDIFTQPLALWKFTLGKLPKSWPHVALAVWSWVASLCAVAIIGGIPYERFWDWGIEERADRDTRNAIASQIAMGSGEEMSMEEAIDEFAGGAGVGDLQAGEEEEEKAPPPKKDMDCLVVGYIPTNADKVDVSYLIVAGMFHGSLKHVATISPDMPDSQRRELLRRLKQRETATASVKNSEAGVWVRPGMVCRVMYRQQDKTTGKLREAEFDRMLADLPGYR